MNDLVMFLEDKKYYIISISTIVLSFFIYSFFLFKVPQLENKYIVLFVANVINIALIFFTLFYLGIVLLWKFLHGQKVLLRGFFFCALLIIAFTIGQGLRINHYTGLMSIKQQQAEQK